VSVGIRHRSLSRAAINAIAPPRRRSHRNIALSGISSNVMQRLWIMNHKSAADWQREAGSRQIAIIQAGIEIGCVVKTANGYEVLP
jgi:hypothetical protein